MAILKLHNITKKYAKADYFAVNNVSLEVESGEILALVGESGSGKTTLLRLIAGLEHPNDGNISLSGVRIVDGQKSVPANERKVGMVFQDYALFPHLNVLDNVKFGLTGKNINADQVAKDTLQMVGLHENFKKYPHQLSGGQQQRVALARAIAPNPSIILLDEPFSNLDAMLKDQVREEIRQIIKKTKVTAVFVTHDTRDALSTADRIAILHNGLLQQIGTPKSLYEEPVNAYVANFFGKQNSIIASAKDGGFLTPFGFLPDTNAYQYPGEVQLLFRPEHVSLGSGEDFPLNGSIFKVSYFGDHQIVKIADPQGKRISLKTTPDKSFNGISTLAFSLNQYKVISDNLINQKEKV